MQNHDPKSLIAPKRLEPIQNRAETTVAKILLAAGEVLVQDGVERFSTNLVCKAAGVTPPALYRYFPDKYALLEEMGLRLMAHQNARLESSDLNVTDMETSLFELLMVQYQVTVAEPAGSAIMRSLRAVPRLSAVRIRSNAQASELIAEKLQQSLPHADKFLLQREARLAVELGYAALEYLFDEPNVSVADTLRQTARLLAAHYQLVVEAI